MVYVCVCGTIVASELAHLHVFNSVEEKEAKKEKAYGKIHFLGKIKYQAGENNVHRRGNKVKYLSAQVMDQKFHI